jgi:hypothetical protein
MIRFTAARVCRAIIKSDESINLDATINIDEAGGLGDAR